MGGSGWWFVSLLVVLETPLSMHAYIWNRSCVWCMTVPPATTPKLSCTPSPHHLVLSLNLPDPPPPAHPHLTGPSATVVDPARDQGSASLGADTGGTRARQGCPRKSQQLLMFFYNKSRLLDLFSAREGTRPLSLVSFCLRVKPGLYWSNASRSS